MKNDNPDCEILSFIQCRCVFFFILVLATRNTILNHNYFDDSIWHEILLRIANILKMFATVNTLHFHNGVVLKILSHLSVFRNRKIYWWKSFSWFSMPTPNTIESFMRLPLYQRINANQSNIIIYYHADNNIYWNNIITIMFVPLVDYKRIHNKILYKDLEDYINSILEIIIYYSYLIN